MKPTRQETLGICAYYLATALFFLLVEFVKITVSLFAGGLVSLWAIPAAYNERGYSAVGGEWILIIGAVMITYYLLTVLVRVIKN